MDWAQVLVMVGSNLAFLGTNLAMFMWARSEARNDQQEIREIIRSIQEESKDFHARLCVIAEKQK